MNEEFKDYLTALSEKLKWFAHLSPKFIHLFSMNDAKELQKIVPTLDDGGLLFSELHLLKLKISNCIDMNEACDLMKRNNRYPRAQLVFKYLLTIPVSIATNERSFSKLKIIKNYLRTTMSNERLFHLMLYATEKDKLDQLDLAALASDWGKMKDRRIELSVCQH
ncbi:unnamed protein product [Didymodactylos carnosus]|nr:unnamed protein product [Didymodactylos carnosus]CAF4396356.1 unnamed protein product [Didymodactylos carnosus]